MKIPFIHLSLLLFVLERYIYTVALLTPPTFFSLPISRTPPLCKWRQNWYSTILETWWSWHPKTVSSTSICIYCQTLILASCHSNLTAFYDHASLNVSRDTGPIKFEKGHRTSVKMPEKGCLATVDCTCVTVNDYRPNTRFEITMNISLFPAERLLFNNKSCMPLNTGPWRKPQHD
jgi:hypothetical protein